jgi:hypothetical protein
MFRRTMRLVLVAASALLAFAAGVEAQSPVTGTYTWEFAAMIRRGGAEGETSSQGKGQAILTITEVRGDSVFGTLAMAIPGMGEPRPREIEGTVKGNTVTWQTTGQARFNVNGEERTTQTTLTHTATIEGDVIKGTIETTSADGGMSVPARTFEGKRVKS